MSFCFHIVYTPGSVRPLLFLVHSLLQWSDCTFRLVANGCTRQEAQLLVDFCQHNPRLHFLRLPSARMMGHGPALNYLQAHNDGDYFCFMDSDIYAAGNFMPEFEPYLQDGSPVALFSGAPLEQPAEGWVMPDGYPLLDGRFNRTKSGLCLGSTYFAIYNNQRVSALRRAIGIGFEGYHWEKIPVALQKQLTENGLVYPRYDTARVFNLFLHLQGATFLYQPSATLRHLGGVSRLTNVQTLSWVRQLKIYAKQWLKGERLRLSDQQFTPIELYFAEFFPALHHQRPLPALPVLEDATLLERVQRTTAELRQLHAEVKRYDH